MLKPYPGPNADNPRVRLSKVCPVCGKAKQTGLVLCWPCHHTAKAAHDGCYGAFVERRIAACERFLRDTMRQ